MPDYTSPDGRFHAPAGPDASIALAQAMKIDRRNREELDAALVDLSWTDADEEQYQVDMRRIDAMIAEERRVARALAGGIEPTLRGQRSSSSQSSSITPFPTIEYSTEPEYLIP